ncbi:MAG: hypothetical protein G01um101477_564 [Candidatus Doudnabacteria bacterium Gr01-1014_77]|uniref:Dephospho-CoA kinase n=1 Tax=Candidatus Doudnabacteria bacterium Gr01-1014_77 TaxID=2017133 RepID=A0A554JA53_9BACT|nr:MAG: hypothetical protein G01um101477_564 [Candidatus Doudnabacteria bacterium Gr01-1014_77]
MNTKKYIGISGEILAGKSTAAQFFVESFKAEFFEFSVLLTKLLNLLNLPLTRPNYQNMGEFLRKEYGRDVLAKALVNASEKSDSEILVFGGIRAVEELEAFKKLPNFKLIYISAPEELRYKRVLERTEKKGEEASSLEAFRKAENHPAEKEQDKLMNLADFKVENTGDMETFKKQLTEVLEKI